MFGVPVMLPVPEDRGARSGLASFALRQKKQKSRPQSSWRREGLPALQQCGRKDGWPFDTPVSSSRHRCEGGDYD